MRTTLKWASLVVLSLLFSCTHVEEFGDFAKHTKPGVYGSMTPVLSVDEPSTKASVNPETLGYVFEEGDYINIWSNSGTLLIYSVDEVTNDGKNCTFSGGGFTLTDGETYYSAVPLIRKFNDNYHSISTSFEDQNQLANGDASHLAEYTYAYSSTVCAIKNGVLDASFSYSRLNAYMKFELTLPKALTLKKLEIYVQGNEDFFGLNGTSDIATGAFTAVAKDSVMVLQLGGAEGLEVDGQLNAYLAIAPTQPAEYIIRLTDVDNKVYTSPKIQKPAIPANKFTRFRTEVFEGETPGVAKIGEVAYPTLADAVAAVPDDGTATTITMISDHAVAAGITIPASKNIILELNGKVVSYNSPAGSTEALFTNRGTLVIQDNTDTQLNGTGTGLIGADYTNPDTGEIPGYASNTITNGGTLTVKSGKIINTAAEGAACYAIDNNSTTNNAVLNIEGGYVYRERSQAVRMFCNSTTYQNELNISGGIVEGGYAGFWTQLPGSSASSKKLATINITGGEVKGGTYSWYDYSFGDSFESVNYNVSGGKFYGYVYSYAVADGVKPGFITGGLFSKDVTSLCAAGLMSEYDESLGMYAIVPAVNLIYYYWYEDGEKEGGYYHFYEPFEGPDPVLMDGEFIELLGNIQLTKNVTYLDECSFGDPISKGGTFYLTFGDYNIDLNGYAFPIPTGVTVKTDKQTNIFSAAASGYSVVETSISEGNFLYQYTVSSSGGGNQGGGNDDYGDGGEM